MQPTINHLPKMSQRFFPFVFVPNAHQAALKIMRPGQALADATEMANDDPVPIDQQLADAFNSNNAIMAYVLGLQGTNLPALTPEPDWYGQFLSDFSDVKIHALTWINTIAPGLVSIPTGIANYVFTFNLNWQNINSALTALQANPQNVQAQQALLQGLQALHDGFTTQLSSVTGFQQIIDDFAAQLTTDAALMQQAVANAQGTQGYDQQQVATLTNDIQNLHNEISKWQIVVTAAGIGAGVAFFTGAVIAIFTFGAGLAFGIIGALAGIATLIAAEAEIQKLTGQLNQDLADVSNLNQQIAALGVVIQNLQTLITLSNAASQQIGLVLLAWQALGADITVVIADINSAEGDLSSLNLAALQNDLNNANADWLALKSFCLTIAGIQFATATPATANLSAAA